ncbi:helix-turn-helix domain-containing protein [Algoriphagus litoralis]|uniref:helix-turn-helix domain-containing protein n=1 Tax=Algoriphagus litoralis TaxID=2202829 RepID=UPI000DB9C023|nr:helix-turn-helix domain-containing protein [Algoriphagus litoralis]
MKKAAPYRIKSISELHRLFDLPKPDHPLISVIDFSLLDFGKGEVWKNFCHDFYCVACKLGTSGKMKYGQQDFDFDEGMMSFTKPGQVFSVTEVTEDRADGYMLVFKPELIRHYELGRQISQYGFFGYSLAEALHLSEKEKEVILSHLHQMQQELKQNIDSYSQDVIVSQLSLLLSYSNRFYARQFHTRSAVNHDLMAKVEHLLDQYLLHKSDTLGLPTVQYLADELHVSAPYLSDLLRKCTGLSAQKYIQSVLIDKAKELLSTTDLSVKEVAFLLGFEYPQSFSKLFKAKTSLSPLEFRQSFN